MSLLEQLHVEETPMDEVNFEAAEVFEDLGSRLGLQYFHIIKRLKVLKKRRRLARKRRRKEKQKALRFSKGPKLERSSRKYVKESRKRKKRKEKKPARPVIDYSQLELEHNEDDDFYNFADTLNDISLLQPKDASDFWDCFEDLFQDFPCDPTNISILFVKPVPVVEVKEIKKPKRKTGLFGKRKRRKKPTPVPKEEPKKKKLCLLDRDGIKFVRDMKLPGRFSASDLPWSMSFGNRGLDEKWTQKFSNKEFLALNRPTDDEIITEVLLDETDLSEWEKVQYAEALQRHKNSVKEFLNKNKDKSKNNKKGCRTKSMNVWKCKKSFINMQNQHNSKRNMHRINKKF